ncbi:MAG: hypothetical protein IJB66_05830 [Oscillospiraceae bacterium]|nr:hypothetical protein [Oscillospiraceae bacterium]
MKKLIFCFLAAILIFSFSGCKTEETPSAEKNEEPNSAAEEAPEKIPSLYEEILLNFGAVKRHDGTLAVSRKFSFYCDLSAGYPNLSTLTPNTFHSWVMSRTDNSDMIKTDIPGQGSGIYAFTADFYEAEVTKYFDTTSGHLRKSSYYYPEQNCYFRAGIPEANYDITIIYDSAEEKDGTVDIRLTISDSYYGTTKHTLSAKLLPEGGYHYLSYVPYWK